MKREAIFYVIRREADGKFFVFVDTSAGTRVPVYDERVENAETFTDLDTAQLNYSRQMKDFNVERLSFDVCRVRAT